MSAATLSHEMDVGRQNWRKIAILKYPPRPFRTKWTLNVKTEVKFRFCEVSATTLSREMDVQRQKLKKNCDFEVSVATLSHEMDVGRQKLK